MKFNKKTIMGSRFSAISLFFLLFMISIVAAETNLNTYTKDSFIDLKFDCIANNAPCSNNTIGIITIYNPDTTIYTFNTTMTKTYYNNIGLIYYNYSFKNTSVTGTYAGNVFFYDPDQSAAYKYGKINFVIEITDQYAMTTNVCPTTGPRIAIFAIIIGIIVIFLFLSLAFDMYIMGFITSFGVLFIAYTLYGCLPILGVIFGVIGISLLLAFALGRWR